MKKVKHFHADFTRSFLDFLEKLRYNKLTLLK